MFRRRSVSLSLVYGLCKTCSYFFRPVLGGFLFRRRSVSLSLVYGLHIIWFWSYFSRPVSGGLWPAGGGGGAGGGQQLPRLRQACRDRGRGQHDQGCPRHSRGPGGGRQDHPGQNHQVKENISHRRQYTKFRILKILCFMFLQQVHSENQ